MSAVSPDAPLFARIRDALTEAQACRYVQECQGCRARIGVALSALDAAEKGGGEADSGGTAELSPVVNPDQRHVDLLLANIDIATRQGRESIEEGESPIAVFDRVLDFVRGFVSGEYWLIVPPSMWSDEDRAAAIARGHELAEKYGWGLQDPAQQEPPKVSGSACPPPSVEALEAERDEGLDWYGDLAAVEADRDRAMTAAEKALRLGDKAALLTTLAQERASAAEAGRDQAIKERDHYEKALQQIVAHLTTADGLNIPRGEAPKLHARNIADSALAGVPGDGHGAGQDNLGGTADAVPGGSDPKGES